MGIKLNTDKLERQLLRANQIDIKVGIIDQTIKKINSKGQFTSKYLHEVAEYLDDKYGIFTNARFDKKVSDKLVSLITEYLDGDFRKAEREISNLLSSDLKKKILNKEYGSNKPSTIAKKGFDLPMFETGQFSENIQAEVIIK